MISSLCSPKTSKLNAWKSSALLLPPSVRHRSHRSWVCEGQRGCRGSILIGGCPSRYSNYDHSFDSCQSTKPPNRAAFLFTTVFLFTTDLSITSGVCSARAPQSAKFRTLVTTRDPECVRTLETVREVLKRGMELELPRFSGAVMVEFSSSN